MKSILENTDIRLRALEPDDIDLLMMWENDTSIWEYGDTMAPVSRHQLATFLKNYDGDIFTSKQVRLMIDSKLTGTTIGTIDLFDFDFFNSRVAIGILIDASHRNSGYAQQALNLATHYATSFLKIHQCYAIIPDTNTASKKLFEKCGYSLNATFPQWLNRGGKWIDALLFQYITL